MSDAVKCHAGGELGKDPSSHTNPVLEQQSKEYQALVNKNCAGIMSSATCVAQEATKYNKLVDQIHALGAQQLGGLNTIDEVIASAAQENNTEDPDLAGVDPVPDPDTRTKEQKVADVKAAMKKGATREAQSKANRENRVVGRIGTRGLTHISGRQGNKISGDVVSNPGYPDNLPILKDAAEQWKRGSNMSNRSGFRYAASGAAEVEGFQKDEQSVRYITELIMAIDILRNDLQGTGIEILPLIELKQLLLRLKRFSHESSKLSKCAAELDELANQDLDTERGHMMGGAMAGHYGGNPAERAQAAEAVAAMTGDELMAIPVIEYKEQCILLSQITTLAAYSRSLDNTSVKPKDPDGEPRIRRRLPFRKSDKGGLVGNAPLLIEGQSFGLMNKLTTAAGKDAFFNMTNAELSSLQPLIRLYKVSNANDTGPSVEVEIPFDSHASREDIGNIFKKKDKRGFGIGIKSFNLSFEGQDMFAQKRCITAKLSLHAADFEELMRIRTVEGVPNPATGKNTSYSFRYIDLALKTGKNIKNKDYKENDALNFRLKAVFGWSKQNGVSPVKGAVKKALENSFVSINLTPVTHTFDFDEFGRVTFNIEYLAYVEEFYSTTRMNIFGHVPTNVKMLTRKLAFDNADRAINCAEGGNSELQEKVNEIKTDDVDTMDKDKRKMHQFLFQQLFVNNYIHFLNFTREDLKSVLAQGPAYPLAGKVNRGSESLKVKLSEDLAAAFTSQVEEDENDEKMSLGAALTLSGMDSVQIPFFYVADLLNVIMGGMEQYLQQSADELKKASEYKGLKVDIGMRNEEVKALQKSIQEYKKLRIVLGPLEIVDHANGNSSHVNFGDVPVATKYFSEWLTSKLLSRDRMHYPLTQFLKDLFNDLLRNYLNDDTCYPFPIKQKVRLYEAVVTSYPTITPMGAGRRKRDEITHEILQQSNKFNRLNIERISEYKPLLNLKGNSRYDNPNPGIASEMNYFIFHAGRTMPLSTMRGDRDQDEARGIMHYVLGKDKGIVKNISLDKTDTPHLKTVRFEQDGYDGLQQLRELYDVNVKTYANVGAFPGQYIFVDPKGFAPSMAAFDQEAFDLTDLGVGGYYMVTRAEHDFAPGFGETQLTAVWVASAGGEQPRESGSGSNKKINPKCKSSGSGASTSIPPGGSSSDTTEPPKTASPSDKPDED